MAAASDPVQAMRDFKPPSAAALEWRHWLAARDALSPGAWPDDIATATRWYQPQLERLFEDAVVRAADLAQMVRIAAGTPSRERFLTELTLDPPEATSDESGDRKSTRLNSSHLARSRMPSSA